MAEQMVTVLDRENTILNRFIAQMRDVTVQGDSMRFRRNLERAGEIMAYEISKTLEYQPRSVETPLGEAEIMMPDEEIVVATILRAGLPFHQGFLNYFDNAQNAFVSAYRKYSKDNSFNIKVEYISTCELTGKTLIIADPMLATGSSLVMTYNALVEKAGMPKFTHVASVMSLTVAVRPAPSRTVIRPWAASSCRARASLVVSLGTAMVAPSAMFARSSLFPG